MNSFAKQNGHMEARTVITNDDLLVCECGSVTFLSVFHVGIIRSRLVGEQPQQVPIPTFVCFSCQKLVQTVQTQGEVKAKTP